MLNTFSFEPQNSGKFYVYRKPLAFFLFTTKSIHSFLLPLSSAEKQGRCPATARRGLGHRRRFLTRLWSRAAPRVEVPLPAATLAALLAPRMHATPPQPAISPAAP